MVRIFYQIQDLPKKQGNPGKFSKLQNLGISVELKLTVLHEYLMDSGMPKRFVKICFPRLRFSRNNYILKFPVCGFVTKIKTMCSEISHVGKNETCTKICEICSNKTADASNPRRTNPWTEILQPQTIGGLHGRM